MSELETTRRFHSLYDETYEDCLRYVTSKCSRLEDIPDIMQDIYVEVLHTLRRKGPSYVAQDTAFVLHVAKRILSKYYGLRRKFSDFLSLTAADEDDSEEFTEYALPDPQASPEEQALTGAKVDAVVSFVHTKPVLTQKIFFLYYRFQMPLSAIAEELGCPESTVKSRLYRLTHQIRTDFGKEASQ